MYLSLLVKEAVAGNGMMQEVCSIYRRNCADSLHLVPNLFQHVKSVFPKLAQSNFLAKFSLSTLYLCL